jgi:uncharacterized protein YjbI with pentapeptide repeats
LALDPTAKGAGSTARAAHLVGRRLNLDEADVDDALKQGKAKSFEDTDLYQRVFQQADLRAGRRVARAIVPQIELRGAKLTHTLTTDWYAHRVDGRYKRCLSR